MIALLGLRGHITEIRTLFMAGKLTTSTQMAETIFQICDLCNGRITVTKAMDG